jgi:hypothetical protein
MSPDKAQQIGNNLACLAASIAEIAEEIKAMYESAQETDAGGGESESPKPKAPTLEEVRGILADKASRGHRDAVQSLINKHGANRLSDIDPSEYPTLIKEAQAIQ